MNREFSTIQIDQEVLEILEYLNRRRKDEFKTTKQLGKLYTSSSGEIFATREEWHSNSSNALSDLLEKLDTIDMLKR